MAARIILKIEPSDLRKLSERLRQYADNCDSAAKKIEDSSSSGVVTDGFSSTVHGIGKLRKFLRDFVGELGLPHDDLPELLEAKVQASQSTRIARDIKVAEQKLDYHRKSKKKD